MGHRGCCVQGVFGAAVLTQSRAHRPTPYTHACTHAHAHLQPKSELVSWDEEESQKDRSGGSSSKGCTSQLWPMAQTGESLSEVTRARASQG